MKRISLLEKRSSLGPEEFRAYWAHPHAAIVCTLPGLLHYTQNVVVAERSASGALGRHPIAGIVEVWFEPDISMKQSRVDIARYATPEQKADEPRFLDGMVGCALRDEGYACSSWAIWLLSDGRDATYLANAVETTASLADWVSIDDVETAVEPAFRDSLRHRLAVPSAVATLGFEDVGVAAAAWKRAVTLIEDDVHLLLVEQIPVFFDGKVKVLT